MKIFEITNLKVKETLEKILGVKLFFTNPETMEIIYPKGKDNYENCKKIRDLRWNLCFVPVCRNYGERG
jgi:hypothetical protein